MSYTDPNGGRQAPPPTAPQVWNEWAKASSEPRLSDRFPPHIGRLLQPCSAAASAAAVLQRGAAVCPAAGAGGGPAAARVRLHSPSPAVWGAGGAAAGGDDPQSRVLCAAAGRWPAAAAVRRPEQDPGALPDSRQRGLLLAVNRSHYRHHN